MSVKLNCFYICLKWFTITLCLLGSITFLTLIFLLLTHNVTLVSDESKGWYIGYLIYNIFACLLGVYGAKRQCYWLMIPFLATLVGNCADGIRLAVTVDKSLWFCPVI